MTLIERYRVVISFLLHQTDNMDLLLDNHEDLLGRTFMGPRRRKVIRATIKEAREANEEIRKAMTDVGVMAQEEQ